MVMAGLEFMGDIPFREVYIHGTVRDDKGRKMSKSLGNSIDPLTIIDEHGADALRFSLMMLTATGQDVFLSSDKFEIGRNFGTKIWNAARYMQMQGFGKGEGVEGGGGGVREMDGGLLSADDRHIIAKLHEAIASCTENLRRFRFNDAAHAIYAFLWHEYCDWYVEYSKDVFYGQDSMRKQVVLDVMHYVFGHALRLLHPFMPFITEELWHGLGYGGEQDSIMKAPWPVAWGAGELSRWGIAPDVVQYVDLRQEMIRAGRMLRADCGIAPGQKMDYFLKPVSADMEQRLKADVVVVRSMLKAGDVVVDAGFTPSKAMPSVLTGLGTLYMPLEGLVDTAAESEKLRKQLAEIAGHLERVNQKLSNQAFVSKAPREVVAQQEKMRDDLIEKQAKVGRLLEMMG
jgi:valyl-tRNA synthetase